MRLRHSAHLTALAHPRDRARLPGGGRVGAADAGRPRTTSRGWSRLVASVPQLVAPSSVRCSRSAGRWAGCCASIARAGCAEPAARPAARGPARDRAARHATAPVHAAVLHRRRVGAGDRQPDRRRRAASRLGPRRRGRLPRPAGGPGQAQRTARQRVHDGDHAVSPPDRVPADAARASSARGAGHERGAPGRGAGGRARAQHAGPRRLRRCVSRGARGRAIPDGRGVGASGPGGRAARRPRPAAVGLVVAGPEGRPRIGARLARAQQHADVLLLRLARRYRAAAEAAGARTASALCSPRSSARATPWRGRCGAGSSGCTSRRCAGCW